MDRVALSGVQCSSLAFITQPEPSNKLYVPPILSYTILILIKIINLSIPNPCGVCLRDVTNRHYGAQCSRRWFHKDCAKVSSAEYTKLSSEEKNSWTCRSDCVNNQNPALLLSELQNLTSLVNNLVFKVDTI